ncbi:uncharacterized protein LOC130818873 [Amaranthus tricolor]|uniref:uncharacterized protein LOC130818873 n=1 Tax=Amaranthus tricolor TaxID=29722 RepID=UPI002583BD4A|nr:uncharacterized protein LOC130818873 [Amaranthus tricolor]
MESDLAADAILDCVTFQILPENRYGACVCCEGKEVMVRDGPLDQLLEHLPNLKDQIVKGSCDNFKLELPNSIGDRTWFTKVTVLRFLHMIGIPDALKKSIAINNEMSQLEETRKFHLSLYTQAEKNMSSDNSKNELLRAMDSRIAALTEELVSTFNLAAGAAISFQEMTRLQEFCRHFGNIDLRNLLMRLSEKSQEGQSIAPVSNKQNPVPLVSKTDYINKINGNSNTQIVGQSNSLKPVQYNASPAKAAEIERQNLSESDDSSFSSEDDQPPATERSRTLIRSASPRRSASPMRKVQIGRSGSRRTPALAIKSLPYFPPRERIPSYRDTVDDCKSEESEELNKKTEINVTRMSVQDAISLFESRQKDQGVESQKKADSSTNTNKAVLRRWSSGMSESQKFMTHDTMEHTTPENHAEDENADTQKSTEVKLVAVPASEDQEIKETMNIDMGLEGSKKSAPSSSEDEVPACQLEEICEKLDSAEWNRQKEEELNKMLMNFAQYNLSNKSTEPDSNRKRISRLGQNGGLNAQQKERKDEKFSATKSGKRVEKHSGNNKQRMPDKPKPEKSSARVSDIGKKLPAGRTPIVNKNSPVSSNPKKEPLKSAVPKKVMSKSSTLPATRKSWPSTPSPRLTGAASTKSPTVTSSLVTSVPRQKCQSPAPRQKPQLPGTISRPTPKLEKPQLQQKDVKKQQVDTKKNLKVDDSKSRAVPKSGKTTRIKAVTAREEDAAAAAAVNPAKAVVRKVTKKSSVVPLEVKPSTRKVLEKSPVKSVPEKSPVKIPTNQKREIPHADENFSKSEDPVNVVENLGTVISDKMDDVEVQESETRDGPHIELQMESDTEKIENGRGTHISVESPTNGEVSESLLELPINNQIEPAEESQISPAAWEESNEQDATLPPDDTSTSLANPDEVASSGMRVRHSLSQMLLQESSEPDIIEWGNAEHPPSMVYQKDAPKGLKRLLKFARKNKEANGAAWASPYTSEGEDDGDEYRSLGKRNSDNLLKVALHSKNYAEGFLSDNEPLSARSNASNSSARSSNKFQDGHGSSKGARSFFSLSAFRGKN